jgi:hypothetical protein
MKHLLRSGVVPLAAALVMASGVAAHAQNARVNDRSGDVWRATDDEAEPYVAAGSPLNADVDRTTVEHGSRDLLITTTYERLAQRRHSVFPIWTIRTSNGTQYSAAVLAGPGDWPGQSFLFTDSPPPLLRMQAQVEGQVEGQGECRRLSHAIDYVADTITILVPRTCLGAPDQVRVRSTAQASSEAGKSFYDNGHNRGHGRKGYTRLLSAG